MVSASFLGIFVIPGLYVLLQTGREKIKGWSRTEKPPSRVVEAPGKAAE